LGHCETGEFAIVESLLNVLATNVFQIHHGGCEVLVAEPFLQFTNTADIAFQVDGRKCVPKLVQEPVAALLDPNHIAFRPTARDAIKTVFTEAVTEIPDLTPDERTAFAEIITLLSNFEELMADLFTGYFTQHIPSQRKYFYLI
jgi:hypothetical protein